MDTTTTTKKATVKNPSRWGGPAEVKVTITTVTNQWGVTNTVTGEDGHFYGEFTSYTGRTDLTPNARTRRDSKPKTLWSITDQNHRPDFIEYGSRAAALRALVF